MHDITPGGWVEDLGSDGLQVRCIVGFNSGPPMTPGGYNQNVQLFQTEDHVVLLNEMVHNARIIPLDGRAHLDHGIRQWTGDSRGHWEGDTLVVETTNFLRETGFRRGQSDVNLHLTERFTRISPQTLMYEVTVENPTVWTIPWTYQIPMQKMTCRSTSTPVMKGTTVSTTCSPVRVKQRRPRKRRLQGRVFARHILDKDRRALPQRALLVWRARRRWRAKNRSRANGAEDRRSNFGNAQIL